MYTSIYERYEKAFPYNFRRRAQITTIASVCLEFNNNTFPFEFGDVNEVLFDSVYTLVEGGEPARKEATNYIDSIREYINEFPDDLRTRELGEQLIEEFETFLMYYVEREQKEVVA